MQKISPKGIILEHYWRDQDVIEVAIYASNGAFGGTTNVYEAPGSLTAMGARLAGFPGNADDKRSFTLGTFGKQYAGGSVSLLFKCTNRAGHACVEIVMASEDEAESATFAIPVAAFEVDEFARQLSTVESTRDGRAMLTSGTLQTKWS